MFTKLLTSNDAVTYMSQMSLFRAFFGIHGNRSQTLLKSTRQLSYLLVSPFTDKLVCKKFSLCHILNLKTVS